VVEVPLGASRHVVRVVGAAGRLWALKELPRWAAEREHAALVAMERRGVPAVRPAGLVTSESGGDAVLITEYLSDSVLWRSLMTDLPGSGDRHRARVYDAVAVFLVELHRRGVFWGDCSLANLLFRRDGEVLQPTLVDAETAEVHPSLTAGQRRHDLGILQDNLSGGLLDLAAEQQRTADLDQLVDEIRSIAVTYEQRWQLLHARPAVPFLRRQDAVAEVHRLNELGYAVDEVRLTSSGSARDEVRLQTVVAQRRHHATELQRLTGIQVGEGQARVLLGDLRSHARARPGVPEPVTARWWVEQVLRPAVERLHAALPGDRDVVQDYCDLLEVRWLLSEQAGHDVGDDAAVQVLVSGSVPAGAAAELDLSERAS
jgi:tRNA A-37 threonylcarbamoyl transferase component Bud32